MEVLADQEHLKSSGRLVEDSDQWPDYFQMDREIALRVEDG